MRHIICKVQPSLVRGYFKGDKGDQVFILCKQGAEMVMNKRVKKGSTFLARVDMQFIRYIEEKGKTMGPFKSNKTQIGVMAAWGIPLVGYLVHRIAPDVSNAGIHVGMICAAAIVCAHILAYGITDGLSSFGKAKSK